MSLKDNFENHPVVWGLGLLLTGFIAGFGARAYVLPVATSEIRCVVDGLPALEEAHTKQIETLNSQLVKLEASAADHSLINAYQDRYREAADRIRSDIESADKIYLMAVSSLSKKCS